MRCSTLLALLLLLAGCEEEPEVTAARVTDLRGTYEGFWNIERCVGTMSLLATEAGVTGSMRCAEDDWETWGSFREVTAEEDGSVRVSGTVHRAFPSGAASDAWPWVARLHTDGEVVFGAGNANERRGDIYLMPR